jgi:hypothetical protein
VVGNCCDLQQLVAPLPLLLLLLSAAVHALQSWARRSL